MKTRMTIATFVFASLISLASCQEEDPTPANVNITPVVTDSESSKSADSGLKVPARNRE